MSSRNSCTTPEKICVSCNAVIEGRILTALGKTYHPEHFTCAKCREPIKDSKFQQYDGEPYCEEDYSKLFMKKCYSCKQPIKEKIIKALGVEWHEEHFVCTICNKPLAGGSFFEKDGFPYCHADYYANFGEKCGSCGEPITEEAIVALEKKWHQNCFKCIKCSLPVVGDTFAVEDGQPVCTKCS